MIYLDNAATSFPKPEVVYKATDSFFRRLAVNPGRGSHRLSIEASQVILRARRRLAELFNAPDPARIVFTLNTTEALNLAIKGVLSGGDHVVTSSIEHNSVVRPLKALEGFGVKVTKVQASQEGKVSSGDIEAAITANTRLIVLSHAGNVTGTIQPIEEIGQIARRRGILFLVDAAQTAGVLPIDVERQNIDLLAFPGHKGLFGPSGTGGLYIKKNIELQPLREGGTGTESEFDIQPEELPERFEAGTLNSVGIAGLLAGVEFILDMGQQQIRTHELMLVERLIAGLRAIPTVTVFGPRKADESVATVSLTVGGWEPADVGAVLDESFGIAVRTGLHCAPDAHKTIGSFPNGNIRVSPGFFNTLAEIDSFLDAIKKLAASPLR